MMLETVMQRSRDGERRARLSCVSSRTRANLRECDNEDAKSRQCSGVFEEERLPFQEIWWWLGGHQQSG